MSLGWGDGKMLGSLSLLATLAGTIGCSEPPYVKKAGFNSEHVWEICGMPATVMVC